MLNIIWQLDTGVSNYYALLLNTCFDGYCTHLINGMDARPGVCAFNPSPRKAEKGGSLCNRGQPDPHSDFQVDWDQEDPVKHKQKPKLNGIMESNKCRQDVEKLESLHTAGEDMKQFSCCEKEISILTNTKNTIIIYLRQHFQP